MNDLTLNALSRSLALVCGRRSARRLAILIYHRVLPTRDYMRTYEVDREQFDWHMELLGRYFHPLSLENALDLQKRGELPPGSVCVTFDDGYADNVEVALPILRRWSIPATFFISSGYLDGGRMWNDTVLESFRGLPAGEVDLSRIGLGVRAFATQHERRELAYQVLGVLKHLPKERRAEETRFIASLAAELPVDLMMSTSQVSALVDAGMEIGGHTVSHPILAGLNADEARREIADGKHALEALTRRKLRFFAYPNGKPGQDFTEAHREMVSEAGFQAALSTQWGVSTVNSDVFSLPRFTPWDKTPSRFMLRMIRNYSNVH